MPGKLILEEREGAQNNQCKEWKVGYYHRSYRH